MNAIQLKKIIPSLLVVTSLFFSTVAMAKSKELIDADRTVMQVTTSVISQLNANKEKYEKNTQLLNNMLRKDLLPFIDFKAMSKLTLGKHWRKASPAQRVRFTNAYREMLVRSYGKIMLKYVGSTIRLGNSVAGKKPGYAIVKTVVTPKNGAPVTANYFVRNTSGRWKTYNVIIGGVNIITNFRTNFTREVSNKGLDALSARLESIK